MISRTLRRALYPAVVVWAALALPATAPAATCAGADLMPAADNSASLRSATLCLLNEERAKHGLAALTSNAQLGKAAQKYSQTMVRESFFDHVSPGGSTLLSRVRRGTAYLRGARSYSLGENIAWGSGDFATPAETVQGWMESPGHRDNILNRRFRHIGVGVVLGAPEDTQGMPAATYTTDFGQKSTR
jgi:uncharacterized protein YkwD